MRKKKYDTATAYTMLLPMIVLLTIFVIIPFVYAVVVSFYDWSFYRNRFAINLLRTGLAFGHTRNNITHNSLIYF